MGATERLRASLLEAGLRFAEEGYGASVIAGLERELAPLRLPDGLRDLWSRLPVGALGLGPDSAAVRPFTTWFADLSVSWWLWRASRDRPGLMPEALLPVAWHGNAMHLVELAGDDAGGARVFEWRRDTAELKLMYPSVEAWLGAVADLVADESARLLQLDDEARWLMVSEDRERELRRSHAVGGVGDVVASDRATWPRRWQEASRGFDDRRPRRPRELSISEFLWEPPTTATVAGVLRRGTSGPGPARLHLADGTAWLDVWCPAELPGLWLTELEHAVEFDVTPGAGAASLLPGSAPYPPQATATSLRLRTFG